MAEVFGGHGPPVVIHPKALPHGAGIELNPGHYPPGAPIALAAGLVRASPGCTGSWPGRCPLYVRNDCYAMTYGGTR